MKWEKAVNTKNNDPDNKKVAKKVGRFWQIERRKLRSHLSQNTRAGSEFGPGKLGPAIHRRLGARTRWWADLARREARSLVTDHLWTQGILDKKEEYCKHTRSCWWYTILLLQIDGGWSSSKAASGEHPFVAYYHHLQLMIKWEWSQKFWSATKF